MRSLLIVATIVALSAAKPGGYHHQHYQFEQSSAAYRNNELQHKSDEAGRYTKFEDLDSSDRPEENMNYHRTEYNAPSAAAAAAATAGVKGGRRVWKPTTNRNLFAEDTQTNVDKEHSDSQTIATDLDSKIIPAAGSQVQEESQSHTSDSSNRFGSSSGTTSVNDHHPHFGHHFRGHPGHSGGYSGHGHSADFHQSHGEGFQRGYHGHHTEEFHRQHGEAFSGHHGHGSRFHSTTSEPEVLQPIEADDTTFNYDKFKQYGFGKEYLDNTEGATNIAGTGISSTGNSANTNRAPIGVGSSTFNQNPGLTTSNIGKPNREQNPVFTSSPGGSTTDILSTAAANSEMATSDIETTRPAQGSLFVSPTIPTNQNTAGSSGFTTNTAANSEFATSFANSGNSQIEQGNIKPVHEAPGSETIPKASEDDLLQIYAKIDQIAKDMTETQQGMTGTHRLDQFGRDQLDTRQSKQQDILNIRTAQSFDSTQQQVRFDSPNFTPESAVQFNQGQQKDLTQQTQDDDLIEKTDADAVKLEVASQIRGDQQNDMTQHGQAHLQNKQDIGTFTLEDLTQQTQDGFGAHEFGSQEDLTQQTQDGFSKLTQDDLTQQTQDGFGKLEFGSEHQQSQDMTQQSQDMVQKSQMDSFAQQTSVQHNQGMLNTEYHHQIGQQTQDAFGKHELGAQEDLTQQTQDEFAGQEDLTQQEGVTQQTQDEFGKLEFAGQEDLTQQTQDGFGGQQEDLTQQTEDEFGKLEFGQQQQQQQQQQDLTQQTQDGFGKLEIASENHGTQYGRTQQHESHSYSGSNSYSTNYNYGEQRAITAETTQDLTQQQTAHETLDVTQQEQKVDDLKLEEQKESDFNHMSSHDILAKQTNVDETLAEEDATEKPGFWKRVGSKITKTYEKAKESLG